MVVCGGFGDNDNVADSFATSSGSTPIPLTSFPSGLDDMTRIENDFVRGVNVSAAAAAAASLSNINHHP